MKWRSLPRRRRRKRDEEEEVDGRPCIDSHSPVPIRWTTWSRWIIFAVVASSLIGGAHARKKGILLEEFAFTAPVYNFSIEENGERIARSDDLVRVGVPVLQQCESVQFKTNQRKKFDASAYRIGDFAFMRLQTTMEFHPLNRELQPEFELHVRAFCVRADKSKIETTAKVILRVRDVNENSPIAEKEETRVSIDSQIAPFSEVVCLEASDADDGLAAEIVYSLNETSPDFYVEPFSGCIRTLRSPLRANTTHLVVRLEDRASRLFYYDTQKLYESFTSVYITVENRRRDRLNVLVERRPVATSEDELQYAQIAALIRVEESGGEERESRYDVVLLEEFGEGHLFDLKKEKEVGGWQLLTRPGLPIPTKGVRVKVRAGTDSAHDRNTTAEIVVDTVERHNISLTQTNFEFAVREDAPIGKVIGHVKVDTLRRKDGKAVRYRIEPSEGAPVPFSIDEKTGRIRVKQALDYEKTTEYSFNVLAKLTGYGHQTMAAVTVRVEDANDHAPEFPVKLQRMEPIVILPKTKPGAVLLEVSAVDRDSGDNGRVGFKMIPLPPVKHDPPFEIDFETGKIILSRALPANESSWPVGVIAMDWGAPLPRSSQINLVFYRNGTKIPKSPEPRVLPAPTNSHSPVLEDEEEEMRVDEDAGVGTMVGRVPVSDADSGNEGKIRFSTIDEYFDIDEETGEVKVAQSLNELLPAGKYEILHSIEVTALDSGVRQKSAKRKYAVRVRDVNDHAPVFDKPWYRVRVPENTPEGTVLLKVTATDEDGGENGRIRYELAGPRGDHSLSDPEISMIKVDEKTGEVALVGQLDRERAESHRLTVMAFDGGSPSRLAFVNVTIDVEDVNDNQPRCARQVTEVRIVEDWPDGALVGCVAAHDDDADANGRLQYAMETERMEDGITPFPFRVEPHSGCVFVQSKQPLDYEKRNVYNFSLEVSDNGETPQTTLCHLVVRLVDIDENRHPPRFQADVLEASVYENEPVGTMVIALVVRDDDSKEEDSFGGSGNATLDIVGGDGRAAFTIVGREVRTSVVLDREAKSDYWLTVRATDDAQHPLSSHVFIFVRVLDRSDHAPLFDQPFYEAEVKENAEPGHIVARVSATDGDWQEKPPRMKYSIEKGDPQSIFHMDENTGAITTAGPRKLDREMQRMYELEIRVTTLDEEENNVGWTRVYVKVLDENDNSPAFVVPNKQYEVPSGVQGRLCRVLARDDDEGDNARLSFSLSSIDGGFSIDNDGWISTDRPLKAGEVSTLDVVASDGGVPARSTTTRIVVCAAEAPNGARKDNHAPRFMNRDEYRYAVSDADQVGNPVGMLSATDDDGDRLWWSIVENDNSSASSYFALSLDSGTLFLARPIDRLPQEITSMELTARVSDGIAHSDAKVILDLSRQPASRPVFDQQKFSIKISEKTPIGTSLLAPIVKGYGKRPMEYGMAAAESERVKSTVGVDPSSGNVMLIGALDYEAERTLRVVLFARQGSLAGYADLTIHVMDENDNAPQFSQQEYDVTVEKRTAADTLVATVTAYDADEGENGVVVYDVISGNELGFFSLNRETGEIRTTRTMEHSRHYESILTIRASDRAGESGAMSGVATVRIRTAEENDEEKEEPTFDRPLYHSSTRANTPLGSLLFSIHAHSSDGHVRYEAKKCSWFDVHPVSGAVRLKRWLTKVRARTINCTMTARGSWGGEASAKIVIRVVETNEHSPVFRHQIYRGIVRENATAGTTVVTADATASPLIVSALDRDSGPSALIGYAVLNEDPYFTVDFMSGTVRTRRPLDYEKVKEWRFHIAARDMGHPPRTSPLPALVVVTVQDVNDNPPVFEQSSYSTELVLPSVPGVKLLTVKAKDEDEEGSIRYYIRGNDTAGLFRVDSRTGDVIVEIADRKNFTKTEYTLPILATDGVHTSSVDVKIRVRNVSSSDFRFSSNVYIGQVPENVMPDRPMAVVTVAATSPSTLPVTYSLLGDRQDFTISTGTGRISFVGPSLDREEQDHVLLLVQARLHSSPASITQCIVRVSVVDENDNRPRFLQLPYHVALPKTEKKGAKVLTIHAVDSDNGVNGSVTYSSDDLPSELNLHPKNGKITLKSAFSSTADERTLRFTVTASDQGKPPLSSSTEVVVDIVDSARPRFTQRLYEGRVAAASRFGTRVAKVEAKSEADRATVIYWIDEGDEEGAFDVDGETGVVTLRTARPKRHSYNLTVVAMDAKRPAMRDRTVLKVEVPSTSTTSLHFSNATYRVSVPESAALGTPLTVILVDEEEQGVVYAIEGPNATAFRIDSSAGALSLAAPLDYETQRRFSLRLTATKLEDGAVRPPAVTTVVVEVLDANDETPVFVNAFSHASISDAAKAGDFVTVLPVTDKDTMSSLPSPARLLFSVIDGDDSLLVVDKHTGVVRVGRDVEEEDLVEKVKTLNVSVSDGLHTAFGKLTVDLKVSGIRSSAPRFEQSQYVVTVKESAHRSIAQSLVIVRALGGVVPIKYSLGGGPSANWPVSVDEESGRVQMKTAIDYEEQQTEEAFVIPLVAADVLGRRAFSTLTLRIVDDNDRSPEFPVKEYSCSVSSSAKAGESVVAVSAIDEDEGDILEYALLGDSHGLRMDEKVGSVYVGNEAKLAGIVGKTMHLIVRATDSGNPPHSNTAALTVTVLPPDVAVPRFANSLYRFTVSEDAVVGFLVGRVQQIATDVGDVRYEMEPKSASIPISVDRNGRILVQALMDREKQSLHRFTVVAKAAGGAQALATVVVEVEDVNDNAPQFRGTYDGISVREDAPVGTSIAVFSATDHDEASNARLTFSLLESDSSSDVSVDGSSGWLTVAASLDRERKSEYALTARVTDEGGKSTEMPFKLTVEDVNDSPPMFDEKNYTVRLDPSVKGDTATIARVSVTDKDVPPHNDTRLFIISGNEQGFFTIEKSGRVAIAERGTAGLIAAGPRTFELILLAHDGVHSATAIMTIHSNPTTSEDLECPAQKVTIEMSEDSVIGAALPLLPLSSRGLAYSLHSDSATVLPFEVQPEGAIVVAGDGLDREKVSEHSFTRRAISTSSYNSPPSECVQPVRVVVIDANDHAPIFDKGQYEVTVKENEPATEAERVFLVRVHAKDEDAGAAGRVRYAIAPDSRNAPFRVDEVTGAITVVQPLDREERSEYVVTVVATDQDERQPRSAKASVKITVADQNDNAPEFEKKQYTITVMEREAVGYVLLTLVAVGGDEGETVSYALVEGHADNAFVELDEKTGVLKLARSLDYESAKSLSVRVRATDSGDPPLSTDTTVDMEVLDENDNAPAFEMNAYEATVKESAKKGEEVLKVIATDADSEHLGRVAYAIAVSDRKGLPFTVDEETGTVTVKTELDFEKRKEYEFEVIARDGGTPPKTASTRVKITVTDENDHSPVFAECDLSAVVQKSVGAGHVLLSLTITDEDSEEFGGPFKVEIEGEEAEAFTVDGELNVVTTAKLAETKKEELELMIRATDKGGRSSECPLKVMVKEESRRAPKVRPLTVRVQSLYGEAPSGEVGWVEATDEDSEDVLRYSLEHYISSPGTAGPHHFRIEPTQGTVWAAPGLASGIHSFNVSVTDGKYYAYAPVTVKVEEITEQEVENTMIVRVEGVEVAEFFASLVKDFKSSVAEVLNVTPAQIRIISVVDAHRRDRERRHAIRSTGRNHHHHHSQEDQKAVDVAFVAYRKGGRGLMSPKQFYLRAGGSRSEHVLKQPFSVGKDPCEARSLCGGGKCVDEVYYSDDRTHQYTVVDGTEQQANGSTVASSLIVPHFERRPHCECPTGKGGRGCAEEVNGCARSPCARHEMCIPMAAGPGGKVQCVCPPGTTGVGCKERSVCEEGDNGTECAPSVHVDGRAFFEVELPVSVEQRMEMAMDFRTTSREGTLMYTEGEGGDFHVIEIRSGTLAYRWKAGRGGEQYVDSDIEVSDGAWHRVSVNRTGRMVEMVVDRGATRTAEATAGAAVVNLWRWRKSLVVGAKVRFNSSDRSLYELQQGVTACIRGMAVDGKRLVLTSSGLRLVAAKIGCREMAASPCFSSDRSSVCRNGGTCIVEGGEGYRCSCPDRFKGLHCELDSDPCGKTANGTNVCPPGVECIPFASGPQCKCPDGFTGISCEMRDPNWKMAPKPCDPNPCGEGGRCVDLSHSASNNMEGSEKYVCFCAGGVYKTGRCEEEQGPIMAFLVSHLKELVVGGVLIVIITALAFFIYKFCLFRHNKNDKVIYDENVYTPHGVNPNLIPGGSSTAHSTLVQPPPPLPPRMFRGNGNRPTIEVRPYAGDERVSSSRGDSGDSLNGSFGKPHRSRRSYSKGTNESDPFDASCGANDSSARRDIDALRAFGIALPEHPAVNQEDPPLPARRVRGRDAVSRTDALSEEREPLGDDWPNNGRREQGMERIAHAVESEQEKRKRMRMGGGNGGKATVSAIPVGNGKVAVGDTLLSPIECDPEYMTMRFTTIKGGSSSAESQKRPLLAAAEDDESDELEGPPRPAHNRLSQPPPAPALNGHSSMWESRLYDDPAYDSSVRKSEATSALIGDIDATDDEEAPPLPTEGPPA